MLAEDAWSDSSVKNAKFGQVWPKLARMGPLWAETGQKWLDSGQSSTNAGRSWSSLRPAPKYHSKNASANIFVGHLSHSSAPGPLRRGASWPACFEHVFATPATRRVSSFFCICCQTVEIEGWWWVSRRHSPSSTPHQPQPPRGGEPRRGETRRRELRGRGGEPRRREKRRRSRRPRYNHRAWPEKRTPQAPALRCPRQRFHARGAGVAQGDIWYSAMGGALLREKHGRTEKHTSDPKINPKSTPMFPFEHPLRTSGPGPTLEPGGHPLGCWRGAQLCREVSGRGGGENMLPGFAGAVALKLAGAGVVLHVEAGCGLAG